MTPALLPLLLALSLGQSGAADAYAGRVALAAADTPCGFFSPAERALLDALTARSRDDAVRAGSAPDALDRFETRHRAPPASCETLAADAEAHRLHAEHLAATPEIQFPGLHQAWISERRRRGAPVWRVHQTSAVAPARLGVSPIRREDLLVLALRSGEEPAAVRLVMRDPGRQREPLDFTAGGLLPAPYDDPLSAWGAAAGAERRFSASLRLSAEDAARLAPASGAAAYAFAFPDRAIEALRALAPRDGVRAEVIGRRGDLVETLWFEAGMFNAALAVLALPLPDPEPPQPIDEASAR